MIDSLNFRGEIEGKLLQTNRSLKGTLYLGTLICDYVNTLFVSSIQGILKQMDD